MSETDIDPALIEKARSAYWDTPTVEDGITAALSAVYVDLLVQARGEVEDGFREFADFNALHEYLLGLNDEGTPPEVVGYDRADRPVIAWLIESGGDDTWPLGVTLGGDTAERPEPMSSDMSELYYPVRIAALSPSAATAERPWLVTVESTLVNGEDDVMSPEPSEVVWASSEDEAADRIRPRDYDTNLVSVIPASPSAAAAHDADMAAAAGERIAQAIEADLHEHEDGYDCDDCKQVRRYGDLARAVRVEADGGKG